MGGGGSQTARTTTSGTSGPPQLVPEFQPFGQAVGQKALEATGFPELNLQRFAQGQALQVPGLSPLEQSVGEQVANRLEFGIPVPEAQKQAFGMYASLPQTIGQAVNLSPFSQGGLETAFGLANNANLQNPYEMAGANTFSNYAGGDIGNSPAIQQALLGLQSQITPVVQNQAARVGLAQSGFLPMEIGRQYARELVPLYLKGMDQQLQAGAGLADIGSTQAQRALGGQQFLSQTQQALGSAQQQLQENAYNRYLQGVQAAAPGLESIGKTEDARSIEAMKEALAMGGLQRENEAAQAQADYDNFLKVREMALGLINPFGSFTAFSGVPNVTETRKISGGGGFGLGK